MEIQNVNYAKMNANLALCIDEAQDPDARNIDLFIRVKEGLSSENIEELISLGCDRGRMDREVFIATLAANEIRIVSTKEFVVRMEKSGQSKPI